jgi:hypothetical protein
MSLMKTNKETNTLISCILYLNTMGLCYWKGIVHGQNSSIHLQYPSQAIPKIHWAP